MATSPKQIVGLMSVTMGMMAACQSAAIPSPAVLAKADAAAMTEVKSVLAKAMGKSRIELGAGDLATGSTISVLPPRPGPLEDRAMALPTRFDLMMVGTKCMFVRHDTGEEFPLSAVTCRSLERALGK